MMPRRAGGRIGWTMGRRYGPRRPGLLRSLLPAPLAAGVAGLIAAVAAVAATASMVRAEDENVAIRRSSEQTVFSDAEIADGFFKIAFGAELRVAGDKRHIRKFDGPVRVFLDHSTSPGRSAVIASVIRDIRAHVDHLDIALTADSKDANVVVTLLADHGELLRTMRARYGRKRANEIERRLTPECLSGFSEDSEHRIQRAEVLLTTDGGDFRFLDCAYEELLQALGPINDDRSVPWTMFNDDVQMGFFDVYDQYILNIMYDPRVRPGMTRQDVQRLLPDILPAIHQRISGANAVRELGGAEARPETVRKTEAALIVEQKPPKQE
jgi:hypothetical protein